MDQTWQRRGSGYAGKTYTEPDLFNIWAYAGSFTSYSLMGSVYQILRNHLPFPVLEVWRNAQEEILRFKTLDNAVLFAAGACWEGVDFPGDIVSSLIIVRLPLRCRIRSAKQRGRRIRPYRNISTAVLFRICRNGCGKDSAEPSGRKVIPAWCQSWTTGLSLVGDTMTRCCVRCRPAR